MRISSVSRMEDRARAATRRGRASRGGACFALFLVLAPALAFAPAARAQGVQVGLIPQTQTVSPGAGFDLEMDVLVAGSPFNAFDAVVSYDPAALTFVPASPISLQEGSYMTGACGNTFHLFSAAGDSLSMTISLLCNALSLPGPGQIYKLHFLASSTPQSTTVHIRHATFYDAGLYVQPVVTQDATVTIGSVTGVGPIPAPGPARLVALPNPCVAGTTIRVETPVAIERDLVVCDLGGRVVRHLAAGGFGPGSRAVRWDGRGDRGERLAAGVYFARFAGEPGVAPARIALLR